MTKFNQYLKNLLLNPLYVTFYLCLLIYKGGAGLRSKNADSQTHPPSQEWYHVTPPTSGRVGEGQSRKAKVVYMLFNIITIMTQECDTMTGKHKWHDSPVLYDIKCLTIACSIQARTLVSSTRL